MKVEEWLGKDNTLGIDIWKNKYRFENESFDEWLDRVSNGDENLKQLIIDKKFLFGGRILANRGLNKNGEKVTYSNCYVLTPPDDNIESIFDCAKKLARTYSYGGGCGVDISNLAPKGAKVNNTAKHTTGAVSFMDLYSLVTGLIGQNGRRGALMLSISCNHPDLEEFIGVKSNLDKVTKANISVRITDDFMNAVIKHDKYKLSFTRETTGEVIEKEIDAYNMFKKLCEMNWDYAEPGMLFWDRISNWNLLSEDENFNYAGTNPCAEEPLPAGGSCLLGSLNLSAFVDKNGNFDYDDLKKTVHIAIIALNNVLDEGLPLHPLKEQRESVKNWRQIGLGIFGLADMFIKMGIKYGSNNSIDISDKIGKLIADESLRTSACLAHVNGVYPKYNKELVLKSSWLHYNTSKDTDKLIKDYGLNNSQLLTIAPTGTLSTMLGVSGGIEPIFANFYTRKTESLHGHDQYYKVYTPIVEKYIKEHNLKDDKKLPDFFVTAQTLDYKQRINMQSIWQTHIDASISSTVNVPNNFTVEEVEDLYIDAWKKGLKGVTIFRDGCKRAGILTTNEPKKDDKEIVKDDNDLPRGAIINCSDDLIGRKRKLTTGCGSLHLQAWADPENGNILEVYLSKGSTGGCMAYMNGLSRMMSYALRGGCPIEGAIDQLESIPSCPSFAVRTATKHDTSPGMSCPNAVAKALKEMQQELWDEFNDKDDKISNDKTDIKTKEVKLTTGTNNYTTCPICGERTIFEGGCITCKNCGWSKCE